MDLYKEEVMDHYENPRNQGELSGDNIKSERDSNASCGDMVQYYLKIEEGKIVEAKWKGIGCAITTASASKLSEYIRGKKLSELANISDEQMLAEAVGFEVNPGRIKCLTLPIKVIRKILGN